MNGRRAARYEIEIRGRRGCRDFSHPAQPKRGGPINDRNDGSSIESHSRRSGSGSIRLAARGARGAVEQREGYVRGRPAKNWLVIQFSLSRHPRCIALGSKYLLLPGCVSVGTLSILPVLAVHTDVACHTPQDPRHYQDDKKMHDIGCLEIYSPFTRFRCLSLPLGAIQRPIKARKINDPAICSFL